MNEQLQEVISGASHQELIALQVKIERQLKVTEQIVRRDALKAVRETAKNLGFSLEDLVHDEPIFSGKQKQPVAAKYQNPETQETWTGRGRKPNWVASALANGQDLSAFLIQSGGTQ